ncbi:hypothetical protein V500_01095 [Pseudogymnoascus sp. VKM F-4518 (FW-2643)]|nr:hypothetical protein V500_01095 [Pseudogymnoascus sp. VKM F-4518 (FW-2643)]
MACLQQSLQNLYSRGFASKYAEFKQLCRSQEAPQKAAPRKYSNLNPGKFSWQTHAQTVQWNDLPPSHDPNGPSATASTGNKAIGKTSTSKPKDQRAASSNGLPGAKSNLNSSRGGGLTCSSWPAYRVRPGVDGESAVESAVTLIIGYSCAVYVKSATQTLSTTPA